MVIELRLSPFENQDVTTTFTVKFKAGEIRGRRERVTDVLHQPNFVVAQPGQFTFRQPCPRVCGVYRCPRRLLGNGPIGRTTESTEREEPSQGEGRSLGSSRQIRNDQTSGGKDSICRRDTGDSSETPIFLARSGGGRKAVN